MSQDKIQRAFEKKLASITPAISTAYENLSFTPVTDVPYQRVQLVPFSPENPTFGDNYHREVGEFQIYLCYPIGKGKGAAAARAALVKDTFYRSLTLVEDLQEIVIRRTPSVGSGFISKDRYVIPINIEYYSSEF